MIQTLSPLISVEELFLRLDDPALAIFDTSVLLPSPRFDGDYRVESGYTQWQAERIPHARHLDLTHDFADTSAAFSFALPSLKELATRFAMCGITPQITPVLYDKSDGFWAARVWWMLRSIGVTARILNGGYNAWHSAKKPIENTLPSSPSLTDKLDATSSGFTLQPDLWCDLARVLRISRGTEEGTLVCALSSGMFNGTVPTRYSRRGHIPGSLNLPARYLLDDNGLYRPLPELQDILAPLIARPQSPPILYCGGGISAAVLAVALTLSGQDTMSLYDGSLQEWSADPTLPLITTVS